jgi:hypothetical protein
VTHAQLAEMFVCLSLQETDVSVKLEGDRPLLVDTPVMDASYMG